MNALYAQRKVDGICTRGCGRLAADDGQLCAECAESQREHQRRCKAFVRELRRDNGLCADCGAASVRYRCVDCATTAKVRKETGRAW